MSPRGKPKNSRPAAPQTARKRSIPARNELRLLLTCVGRRIELLEAFRLAARALRIDLEIHGSDMSWTAPAIHRVDEAHLVPRIQHPRHIPALLEIVEKHRIQAIIPLIDSDLESLAVAAPRFDALGCTPVISSVQTIQDCADKLRTYELLSAAGIDTPETWTPRDLLKKKRIRFPCFLKPRHGSAGQGLYRVDNAAELRVLAARSGDCIVQEFVAGVEYTLDVYTGLDGVCRCVVPRRRLEVRTGEVSKGLIVKDPAVQAVGRQVAAALGPCRGVITVQCIVTKDGRIRVIEINPRLGGGAPLAIAAGADFPKWLMAELLGRKLRVNYDGFRDNLAMLRYDQSVFVMGATAEWGTAYKM
jgi:carbamoyl-phosphate synthase large subunit